MQINGHFASFPGGIHDTTDANARFLQPVSFVVAEDAYRIAFGRFGKCRPVDFGVVAPWDFPESAGCALKEIQINPTYLPKDHERTKGYAHFDMRVSFDEVYDKISNPEWIVHHSFYPFIRRIEIYKKFSRATNEIKIKERPITYASHIDRCIFQYYSLLLGERYEHLVGELGISDCAIAYRGGIGKSNCDFAHEVISQVKEFERCTIFVIDFVSFFDGLDRGYLIKQLRRLFPDGYIPNDYHCVLKNVLHYSYINMEDILGLSGLPCTRKGIEHLNKRKSVMSLKDFRKHKKRLIHKESRGIPQGSPLSGLLANIYLMEFDQWASSLTGEASGLYRRYCDDAIFVFPGEDTSLSRAIIEKIDEIPGLESQEEKTGLFRYRKGVIAELSSNGEIKKQNAALSYLGFTFDGQAVRVKGPTIGRYYGRLYRSGRRVFRDRYPRRKKKRVQSFYNAYSERGACLARESRGKGRPRGNFLTYIERAKKVFGVEELDRDTKMHMRKIKALRKRRR